MIENENMHIFTESSEELGIMFNSYKGLYKIIGDFLDLVKNSIDSLLKNPTKVKIDLKSDIDKFKKDIDKKITPSEINIKKISSMKSEIKEYRNDVDDLLNRLAKLKNKTSFGGNWYRFGINRPKTYSKDINNDDHETINRNIRNVDRALDWVEKIIIDLYNMIDQDLNILTIVDKIYGKQHIYESYLTEEIEIKDDSEDDEPPALPEEELETTTEEKPIENQSEEQSTSDNEPPELEAPPEEPPVEEQPVEEPVQEEKPKEEEPIKKEEPKEESLPKQTDRAESSKNGVRRKKLYIAFIEWCKEYNNKNTFGSIFDKDAFKVSYPFVPNEMRYFYRLANPMLCVLAGDLTYFPVAELRKVNSKNTKLSEMIIFAATQKDLRVFNNADKKVYRAIENNGNIELVEVLGDTFDTYLQNMINKGDILNAPIEESTQYVQLTLW